MGGEDLSPNVGEGLEPHFDSRFFGGGEYRPKALRKLTSNLDEDLADWLHPAEDGDATERSSVVICSDCPVHVVASFPHLRPNSQKILAQC